ncbi:hypothetical protein CAEBREN_04182 [Caenorhabditis brenneri]|uniref:Fibronectin type-III domain-containing protein n=1 Tax=Caenorhabditis brenneri TaxID=135651 RepID=G0NMJ2_CAEBE|nr:hypothetical protein CAEBREN_04182 [Caenorhabditis brenneri]
MLWNRPMFISLLLSLFAVIVNSKYRGPPDAIKMITVRGSGESDAVIEFNAFEVDTKSYKIEFVDVHDGKSMFNTVKEYRDPFRSNHIFFVKGLEPNKTYIIRVFAINEHGQSPPSPDIIFSLKDSSWPKGISDSNSRPMSPHQPIVEYMLRNRVKVTWTWTDLYDIYEFVRNRASQFGNNWNKSPAEYVIRYGDNKNTSLWTTRKTNEKWIILDDLKKDTHYSAYVLSKKDNLTSLVPFIFPISLEEDMTGLPEPVIRIESAFKKEVFTPGDPMTITCSIPPNSNMLKIDMELTVGERDEFLSKFITSNRQTLLISQYGN